MPLANRWPLLLYPYRQLKVYGRMRFLTVRAFPPGQLIKEVGVDAVVVEQPLAVDAFPFGKEAFAGIAADDGAGILEDALKAIHRRGLHPTNQPGRQVLENLWRWRGICRRCQGPGRK